MAIVISLDSSISATARPTRTFRSVRLVGQMYGKSSLTVLVNVARSRTERLSARTLEISGCRMDPRALVRSIWQAYRRFDLEPTLTPVTSHVDFSVYDQGKRRIGREDRPTCASMQQLRPRLMSSEISGYASGARIGRLFAAGDLSLLPCQETSTVVRRRSNKGCVNATEYSIDNS